MVSPHGSHRDTAQVSSALQAGDWTPDGFKLPHSICPQRPHPTSASALAGSHLTRHCALHSLLRKCHLHARQLPEALLPQCPLGQCFSVGYHGTRRVQRSILGASPTAHKVPWRQQRPAQPTGGLWQTVTVGCAAEVSDAGAHTCFRNLLTQAPGLGLCPPSSGPLSQVGAAWGWG